jgi:hypothetical protein
MSQGLPQGLKDLLNSLEKYAPVVSFCGMLKGSQKRDHSRHWLNCRCVGCLLPLQVPDEVTQHSLWQSGYECNDVRT